tara:strand:+ start:1197 stop:1856 length:660 start_codon:yes stop_codon:yes gene_type:complete
MITMRTAILSAIAALLAGCATTDDATRATAERVLDYAQQTITPTLQESRYIAAEQAGAPLLKFGIEDLEVVTIGVFDTRRDGIETWLTASGPSFAIEDGFLRNTRGLGDDLMSSDVSQIRAAVLGRENGTVERFMTFIGPEEQTVTRSYVCDIEVRGARDLTVNTLVVNTTLVAETCTSTDQNFENLYWLRESNGKMVQSRQWASNKIGPVVMRDGPNR